MKSGLDFVSIACNPISNVADWGLYPSYCGSDGCVAYGAGVFVSLYDVQVGRIYRHHSTSVNLYIPCVCKRNM